LLPFDQAASDHCDRLIAQRIRVGTMDLRIASIALVHGFTLLTRNLRDFQRVPNLNAEDWTT
jgi:tRNA(fMet)-specific endonuclease VapC